MKRLISSKDEWPVVVGSVMGEVSKMLDDGPVQISVSNPKRSAIQSAKIHAMIGDIAKMVNK